MSLVSSNTLEQGFEAPRRYLAAAAILIGVVMAALDSSIVNISLPSIAEALRVDSASVIWVTNGYQVASAATMLICASLGSRIGSGASTRRAWCCLRWHRWVAASPQPSACWLPCGYFRG